MQTVLACGAQHVLNCSVHSTWTDEDFIGRISRISRRSHVLTAARNTLQRALGHYRRQFGSFFDPVYLRDSQGRTWKNSDQGEDEGCDVLHQLCVAAAFGILGCWREKGQPPDNLFIHKPHQTHVTWCNVPTSSNSYHQIDSFFGFVAFLGKRHDFNTSTRKIFVW